MRAKRVKRMSAAPKKAARTRASGKKTQLLPPWVAGPGPILFGVACVVCFVGAVALNLASEPPRKPDVAIAAAATVDPKASVPQKPRAKAERPQATAAPSIDAKTKTVAPEETQPAAVPLRRSTRRSTRWRRSPSPDVSSTTTRRSGSATRRARTRRPRAAGDQGF